jgi:hypothetical protein
LEVEAEGKSFVIKWGEDRVWFVESRGSFSLSDVCRSEAVLPRVRWSMRVSYVHDGVNAGGPRCENVFAVAELTELNSLMAMLVYLMEKGKGGDQVLR